MTLKPLHIALNIFIALVWLINGIYCKVLDGVPRHQEIIAAILGETYSDVFTLIIGISEIVMAGWILSGIKKAFNTYIQIIIILVMNALEFILVPELLLWGKWNSLFAVSFCLLIYLNHKINTKI